MADQFTRRNTQILTGQGSGAGIQYLYAPAMDGAGGGGATVTSGAGAWGAYKDLAAAGAITTEFWACGLAAYTAGAIQIFQLQVYNATLTRTLMNFVVDLTATTLNLGPLAVLFPIYCAAGSQIQARAGGAAAKTINCHLAYVLGL